MKVGDADFHEAVELTLDRLRDAARLDENDPDGSVTYRELSLYLSEHGLRVPYHEGPMPHILAEASRREHEEGRGMISVLVVQQDEYGKKGLPSTGFYRFARQAPFSRVGDELTVWMTEMRRVRQEHRR